jgi:hypothetical protein
MSARTTRARGTLLLTATLTALLSPAVATPVFAIDKEHRQMEADLRMLQEQSQQHCRNSSVRSRMPSRP